MGNTQPNINYSTTTIINKNNTTNSIKKKFGKDSKFKINEIFGLRSQSTDNEIIKLKNNNNNNYLFTKSAQQSIEINEQYSKQQEENNNNLIILNSLNNNILPKIEINGGILNLINNKINEQEEKLIKNNQILNQRRESNDYSINNIKHKAQKVDSRKITAKKRLERGQTTNSADNYSLQNIKKNSFSERIFAKSLDHNTEYLLETKYLNSSNNLLQQKCLGNIVSAFGLINSTSNNINNNNYSFSSSSSSNINLNILTIQQSEAIQNSWLLVNEKIKLFAGPDRNFAFFIFDRIFERAPELKHLFGISPNISLIEMDEIQLEQHSLNRHIKIFNNIIDLAVRNSSELEIEMFPVLFAYGQRHYKINIIEYFNEKTVRLFCSQIIGTLCDLLDKKLSNFAQEAWIDMFTYLGRALLLGFEHERQKRKRFTTPKIY